MRIVDVFVMAQGLCCANCKTVHSLAWLSFSGSDGAHKLWKVWFLESLPLKKLPTLLLWRADPNISMLTDVDIYVITEEIRCFTLIGGIICWTALQPCHFLEKFLWHNIEKTFSNKITQQLWNPIMSLDSTVGFLHNITVTITIMLVEFLSE